MAKTQLDFSGARNIIDPLEGLRASMQQASSNLGQMITQDETRVRQARQDARQDKQDLLATPGTPEWLAAKEAEKELKMGLVAAEHNWKMENDKGYRATIPGTEEYELARQNKLSDETAIINAKSAADLERDKNNPATKVLMAKFDQEEKIRKGQEVLANAFANIPKNNETIVTTTPEQVDKARTVLESSAVTSAGDAYNKEFTRLTKPETRLDVDANGEVILVNTAPAISPEGAHQKAMEKAKLLDLVAGKAPVINESMLPKAGTVKTEKAKTPEELTQAKLDVGVDLVKKGLVPATILMEVANKLNPVKTNKEKLDETEMDLKIKKLDAEIAGGKYNEADKDTAYSVGEKLYAAAGPDGINAVKTYLENHKAELAKKSTADKKALVAELTAKYGHEEDWFNTVGWDELK